jgi:hypothetical protein
MFLAETTTAASHPNTSSDHAQLIAHVSSDTNAYTGLTTWTVQTRQVNIFTVAEATRRPGLPPFPLTYIKLWLTDIPYPK